MPRLDITGMNILIVDDDPLLRTLLHTALTRLGHQVSAAQDGIEALSFLEKCAVPLVISDILMPRMDGLELCRCIRKAGFSRYVYVILLTAVDGKPGFLSGMQAGADDFMVKPFDSDMLAARLGVAERILGLQLQVNQLAKLLPICSICKKVRDDQNYWHQVEAYITRHTDAKFTHSYCPDCFNKLVSELGIGEPETPNQEQT